MFLVALCFRWFCLSDGFVFILCCLQMVLSFILVLSSDSFVFRWFCLSDGFDFQMILSFILVLSFRLVSGRRLLISKELV